MSIYKSNLNRSLSAIGNQNGVRQTAAVIATALDSHDSSIASLTTSVTSLQNQYLQFGFPDQGDGTNALRVTTEGATYGHFTFSNSVAKASNYVLYRLRVPDNLDTTIDLQASFSFRLGGADTGKHSYYISMADVAASASADAPTFSNEVALSFAGDASGAS